MSEQTRLHRDLGVIEGTALNVANMVGIGPFITIPLFIATMSGPHALMGWIVGALLVLCDGLVWSEFGAALPGSGGTYHFLRGSLSNHILGRILPFLFIWQFLVSGALEMASGYIGAIDYLIYVFPNLDHHLRAWYIPGGTASLAAFSALAVTASLCRPIRVIGWMGVILCAGTLVTVFTIIIAGLVHFNPQLLTMPPNAFTVDGKFAMGLGAAMAIAVYDYFGYYNICHLGDEARNPERTIPRAIIISVLLVATLYLTMNLAIIAVVPWREAMHSKNVAALFMETLFGRQVAVWFTGLILWTVLACMFAITVGYSRIPFAAARQGDFFPVFAYLHPVHGYPVVSLLVMGLLTALCCYLPLGAVILAAVTVRIIVQFIGQIWALDYLRHHRPDVVLPFRMWCYPLPSFLALAGWTFIFVTSPLQQQWGAFLVLLTGCLAFAIWQALRTARGG